MTNHANPPRGWYDDPADEARERYWDGAAWTQRVRRKAEPVRRAPAREPALDLTIQDLTPAWRPLGSRAARAAAPADAAAVTGLAPAVPLASWGRRAGGALIDYVIISLIFAVVVFALGDSAQLVTEWEGWLRSLYDSAATGSYAVPAMSATLAQLLRRLLLVRAGVILVYSVVFLATWGATPGMRLAGCRVVPVPPLDNVAHLANRTVPADQAAVPVGWGRALWRSLTWVLLDTGGLLVLLQLFSVLMPLWHPRRQTIHDMVARTVVVRRS
ncbi:MAG: RDD family protein [Propionibacteriaceae bacterium]|nr:RDD family protein [Propionibacteriaceae bacterium]